MESKEYFGLLGKRPKEIWTLPRRDSTRLGAGPFFEDPDPDPDPKKKIVRTRTRPGPGPGPGVLLPRLATLRSEVKIERNDEAYTKAFILRFILIVLNSPKK